MKQALIVEDSDIVREILTQILEISGLNVLSATGTDEARAIIASQKLDIVFCDLSLPTGDQSSPEQQNGLSFIKDVHISNPELPILAMSGDSSDNCLSESKACGAVKLISKPFGADQILSLIDSVLR